MCEGQAAATEGSSILPGELRKALQLELASDGGRLLHKWEAQVQGRDDAKRPSWRPPGLGFESLIFHAEEFEHYPNTKLPTSTARERRGALGPRLQLPVVQTEDSAGTCQRLEATCIVEDRDGDGFSGGLTACPLGCCRPHARACVKQEHWSAPVGFRADKPLKWRTSLGGSPGRPS